MFLFCEAIARHEASSKNIQETRLYDESQMHIFDSDANSM